MLTSRSARELEIARSRSVVKVAIPQRRGSELPMNAKRLVVVKQRPLGPGPSKSCACSISYVCVTETKKHAKGERREYCQAGIHSKTPMT